MKEKKLQQSYKLPNFSSLRGLVGIRLFKVHACLDDEHRREEDDSERSAERPDHRDT